jgi:curved DNA-binding protein
MTDDHNFIDYYEVLQVSQDCDPKTLEAAYRRLAKMYHPDRMDTADTAKFDEVMSAFRVLRDANRRQKYDALRHQNCSQKSQNSSQREVEFDEESALRDADDHEKILAYLYSRRREDAQNPGVIAFYLQEMLNCSHEHFEFHKWYLKEKGFIAITEQGTLAITIQGADHVIGISRVAKEEKLFLPKSTEFDS